MAKPLSTTIFSEGLEAIFPGPRTVDPSGYISPDRFGPNDSLGGATDLGLLGDRTENDLTVHAPEATVTAFSGRRQARAEA